MKYGYEEAKSNELIRNYKTSNDKIIITFLDGSSRTIDLTKKAENELLKQMLEQAKNRSESSALYDARYERKNSLKWTLTEIGMTILNISGICTNETEGMRVWCSILSGVTGILTVINGVDYKLKNDEIKELEKYNIYLSIREDLENVTDSNLFDKVKNKNRILNINTLDDYSLNDIKKIRQNLEVFKRYQTHSKPASNKQLLKK